MLNSILETRERINGLYQITLHINDDTYFTFHDTLNEVDATELLEKYLIFKADGGRPDKVSIKHNKNEHVVIIKADLKYADNEKTEAIYQ